jgi:hypothetical protein
MASLSGYKKGATYVAKAETSVEQGYRNVERQGWERLENVSEVVDYKNVARNVETTMSNYVRLTSML